MTEIYSPPADVGKQHFSNSQIFNDKINLVKSESPSVFNSNADTNNSVFSNYQQTPKQTSSTPDLISFDKNNNYKKYSGLEDKVFSSDEATLSDIGKALGNLVLDSSAPSAVFPGAIVEFGGNKYLYAALTPTNDLSDGNFIEAGKNTTHFLSIMNKGIIFTANYGTGSVETGIPAKILQGPIKNLPFMDKMKKVIPDFFVNGTYFTNARIGPNNMNSDSDGGNVFTTASFNQGLFFPVKSTSKNANNMNKAKQAMAIQMVQNFSPAMIESTIGVAGATVLKVIDTGTDIIAVLGLATAGLGTAATLASKKAVKHVVINKVITEIGKSMTPVVGVAFRSEMGVDKNLEGRFSTPAPDGAPTELFNQIKSFFGSKDNDKTTPTKSPLDNLSINNALNSNSINIKTPNADLYAFNNLSPSPAKDEQTPVENNKSSFEVYTVKKGDTLGEIAKQKIGFINYEALLKANPQITNPDFILEGQVINIPIITS